MSKNLETNFINELEHEYQKIDNQWLILHYRTTIGVVCLGLIVEFLLSALFYKIEQPYIALTIFQYYMKYVVNPFLLNVLLLIISVCAMKIPHLKSIHRVYLLSISLIGVCMVFYSVHYIYSISIIFFAPVLFTAFYGKYSLTTNVALLTILGKLVSDLFIYYDSNKPTPFDLGISMMNTIVSTLLLLFFYGISMVIIHFQKKKNSAAIQKEQERQAMQKQLLTDPLTGINNRLALLNVFQTINQTTPTNYTYFAMMDLDFFKMLNDSLGHATGDQCLQKIGNILNQQRSQTITPFRFGGDEFCILFEETSHEQVLHICDTLQQQINTAMKQSFDLHLTISIGIAEYTPAMFAEDLLKNADTALYQAKTHRNHIVVYPKE